MNDKKSQEDFLNKIVYLMQTDRSEDAPQNPVKWAKNIFRARVAEPKKSLARKVLAILHSGSLPLPLPLPPRPVGPKQSIRTFQTVQDLQA